MLESLETPVGSTDSPVKVEVISGPETQADPVSPRTFRDVLIAALLGLLAGAVVAIQLDLRDTSVRDGAEVEELTGASVLAHVPFDATAKRSPLLIGDEMAFSARAEALRALRTNLRFTDVDNPPRTIVISSSMPGEGKSSTAANLGIVLADNDQRVLLIDGDLRRPTLADYFDIEGAVGLTNVLAGQVDLDTAIQQWNANLWILPSGILPPNPSELLGSQHMTDLLERVRERFGMVLIDSPPLLSVTDAAVLATRADGVLYVARSGRTTIAQMAAAAQAAQAVDAKLLGTVLNMEKSHPSNPYQQYGYPTEAGPRQHVTTTPYSRANRDKHQTPVG
jgi:capsular exopolysaccharide synthesis family protein